MLNAIGGNLTKTQQNLKDLVLCCRYQAGWVWVKGFCSRIPDAGCRVSDNFLVLSLYE